MNPIKLSELTDVLEFDTDEHVNLVDLQNGRVVSVERSVLSAAEEGDEDSLGSVPEWQKEEVEMARAKAADSGERFVDAPDKFDFHEYRHMERFIGTVQDDNAVDQLWRAIKGKGAFRYFKDTAHRLGLLEQWYRYREEAMKEFVVAWAEVNHIPIVDDTQNRRQNSDIR
jgi:hypothetical protein